MTNWKLEGSGCRVIEVLSEELAVTDKNYEKKPQIEIAVVPAETQTDQIWNMSLILPLHQSAQKIRQGMYV
jgi:hypothetical protein